MSLVGQVSQKGMLRDRRRGVRVNSCVPVVLEWEGESGATLHEEAHTRVVGPYGCLVVTSRSFDLEQRIRLTNLATRQSNPAVVVWKGNERAEGWEFGIELINPEMGFWGVEL